jgi:hypothetical protein
LDDFLIDLAQVAVSENKLVVGGYVPPKQLCELQSSGDTQTTASPEELCISYFFDAVVSTISAERKPLKRQSISFFFDHTEDDRWKNIIQHGYNLSCKKHKQFVAHTIVSRGLKERAKNGDLEFLPLQAADMVAYRMRQLMENIANLDFTGPTWDKLDNILFDKMNSSIAKQTAKQSIAEREAVVHGRKCYPDRKLVPGEIPRTEQEYTAMKIRLESSQATT